MSKSKVLREGVNVVVSDEFGEPHTFLAGSTPPKWAAEKMGDHCWEGYVAPSRRGDAAPAPSDDGSGDGGGSGDASEIPPMGGAGSGRDEWAAYAGGLGVEVDDADNRDAIVDKLKAGGHPTTRD